MMKIAVMGSGNGSNFQAIAEYFADKSVDIQCISDIHTSYILKRAEKFEIKSHFVPFEQTENFFRKNKFDLVVLAGYMRILPENVLELSNFINIHPSLLPKYKGKNAIEMAFEAGERYCGITIHRVTKEIDSGEILFQIKIPILPNDTIDTLTERVHALEHKSYPKMVEELLAQKPTGALL